MVIPPLLPNLLAPEAQSPHGLASECVGDLGQQHYTGLWYGVWCIPDTMVWFPVLTGVLFQDFGIHRG